MSKVPTRSPEMDDLLLSAARLRRMVDVVKDYAIIMLDPDGRIVSWNSGAEVIKGYTATEVIGEHISIFYSPEDNQRELPSALLATAEREGRVEDEGWRVRKDGSRFWADVVITAMRESDETLLGFGKVTRDLTERRRADERRSRQALQQAA